ncbi:MAG: glycosyltransferase family 4 protein [Actinomycetota bacterium]|nr:glycosyltransferase family 4 protein [Actinomycetota bacterium]
MRVHIVDPPAFTPAYDHALCAALAGEGADVELVTSRFAYGCVPTPEGYRVHTGFYRRAAGLPGSRRRRLAKLAEHPAAMLAYRRRAASADVVHVQWLTLEALDRHLLPRERPVVVTAHDILARDPLPGQRRAQHRLYGRVDAVVVHSRHGRSRLVDGLGLDPARVHVIPHGAFEHLTRLPGERRLSEELDRVEGPLVLLVGRLEPYKGVDVLLEAWRGITGAELWVVGLPKMPLEALRRSAPPSVRWMPRFVTDHELAALLRRADVVVLPYREIDQSGVLFAALAFGRPIVLSAVGGFPEVAELGAAALVPPEDAAALHAELARLLRDPAARRALSSGAQAAARGPFAWPAIARRTLALYRTLGAP